MHFARACFPALNPIQPTVSVKTFTQYSYLYPTINLSGVERTLHPDVLSFATVLKTKILENLFSWWTNFVYTNTIDDIDYNNNLFRQYDYHSNK